jgi:ribonuclease G
MVLLTGLKYVGVSKKIESADERARLRGIGLSLTTDRPDGIILRTAANGMSGEDLRAEYVRLVSQWEDMKRRSAHSTAPGLIYDDNDLALQAVRDRLSEDVEAIWTDDDCCYERLKGLAELLSPALSDRILKHTDDTPLFDLYRVDSQADKAMQRYVWLKSGGSLVIDETEALTVVDVNTGKNTGKRDADDTILATNCEAARELMRQLRLRDIGGMIVVDFIDMRRAGDQDKLLDVLRECAAKDRNRTRVVDYTALGLVELTRKRMRQSLSRQLTHTCSHCDGNGIVPSHETTARKALRDLWRRRRAGDETALTLEAVPAVCGWIRKIGVPEGGQLRLSPVENMGAGEYRFAPIDFKR